ncbi:hypothetical protein, partial [Pseudomonas syringae]|uniref:hypothetical protein n=1 Tax=Pseudomonas syringae TaxID=317 RepID=UPI00196762C5
FDDAASCVDQIVTGEQIKPIGKARPLTERQEDHLTFKVMRLDKIDLLFFERDLIYLNLKASLRACIY